MRAGVRRRFLRLLVLQAGWNVDLARAMRERSNVDRADCISRRGDAVQIARSSDRQVLRKNLLQLLPFASACTLGRGMARPSAVEPIRFTAGDPDPPDRLRFF